MRVLDDAPWRAGRGETWFLLFTPPQRSQDELKARRRYK
jgi:hypothetical protein